MDVETVERNNRRASIEFRDQSLLLIAGNKLNPELIEPAQELPPVFLEAFFGGCRVGYCA